jgi:acetoin utilization protein AcuB
MLVGDVMSDGVRTIDADESLEAASLLMRRYRIRHLVVLDDGELAGVLSNTDLANLDRSALADGTVREHMSDMVVRTTAAATLGDAANLMRGRTVGCLPVMDDEGRCVGIVTVSDLLDVLGRGRASAERTPADD